MPKLRFPLSSRITAGEELFERVRERYREPMVNTPFRLAKTGVRPRK